MGRNKIDDLPRWFGRPHSVEIFQQSLFQTTLKDELVRLRISADELSRWYSSDWVSFDGSTDLRLNEHDDPRILELIFVRDISRSGLSDSQLKYLFDQLPKPFAFDPDRIAYSFRYGWVEIVQTEPPENMIEDHIYEWLEMIDTERLQELQEQISKLLDSNRNDPNGGH